jgi:hypothetical protein
LLASAEQAILSIPLPRRLLATLANGTRPVFATTLVGQEGSIEYKFGIASDFISK